MLARGNYIEIDGIAASSIDLGDLIHHLVGMGWGVMKEHEPPHIDASADLESVLRRGMTPVGKLVVFLEGEVGIVDNRIRAVQRGDQVALDLQEPGAIVVGERFGTCEKVLLVQDITEWGRIAHVGPAGAIGDDSIAHGTEGMIEQDRADFEAQDVNRPLGDDFVELERGRDPLERHGEEFVPGDSADHLAYLVGSGSQGVYGDLAALDVCRLEEGQAPECGPQCTWDKKM